MKVYNLGSGIQASRMANQQVVRSQGSANPAIQNDYLNGLLVQANREKAGSSQDQYDPMQIIVNPSKNNAGQKRSHSQT